MYVLTLRQPWAWLVIAGHKTVEYRSWRTAYRGRFLVHAGLGIDWDCPTDLARYLPPVKEWAKGAIIGSVELVDCLPDDPGVGDYEWLLAAPKALAKPFPATGKVGFWTPPDAFLKAHEGQL